MCTFYKSLFSLFHWRGVYYTALTSHAACTQSANQRSLCMHRGEGTDIMPFADVLPITQRPALQTLPPRQRLQQALGLQPGKATLTEVILSEPVHPESKRFLFSLTILISYFRGLFCLQRRVCSAYKDAC